MAQWPARTLGGIRQQITDRRSSPPFPSTNPGGLCPRICTFHREHEETPVPTSNSAHNAFKRRTGCGVKFLLHAARDIGLTAGDYRMLPSLGHEHRILS